MLGTGTRDITTQLITHDDQARLTGTSFSGVAESWSYDGNGNVLTASLTTTSATQASYGYSAAITPNEVLTVTTTGHVPDYFSYDANGDTTAITNTQGLNVGLGYGVLTATLSYNAAGQRAGYSVVIGTSPYYSAQFSYRGGELGQAVIVELPRFRGEVRARTTQR